MSLQKEKLFLELKSVCMFWGEWGEKKDNALAHPFINGFGYFKCDGDILLGQSRIDLKVFSIDFFPLFS